MPDESVFCPYCGQQVPDAEECQEYTYEAFISYRHRDLDRSVVKRLQRFLEGLRAPKQIAATNNRKRLGKLFRDEDELPTSCSLSEQIETALAHSRYLVVACSPQARESLWVQREVELFASLHGRDRIILALVEGEPEESFPPLLLHRAAAAADGTIRQDAVEPIAADFRVASQKKFKDEALRIAAVLFGCDYDELRQRMRVRRMRAIAIAAAAIAVVSIAFGSFSLYQQTQIQKNHRTSQIHESELLAAESDELLKQGDRYQAIQVALRALPESTENASRPIVPAALLALQRAIGLYPSTGLWAPDYSLPLSTDSAFRATDDGYLVMATSTEDIDVYNLPLGDKIYTIEKAKLLPEAHTGETTLLCMSQYGERLFCCYGNTTWCFEAYTGKLIWNAEGKHAARYSCVGEDVISILYSDGDTPNRQKESELVTYDAASGKVLQTYKLDNSESKSYELIACDKSGRRIGYLRNDGMLFVLDLSGKTVSAQIGCDNANGLRFDKDRIYVLAGERIPKTVTIEAFDAELNQLWTHEEHIFSQWSDTGEALFGDISFCGEDFDGNYTDNLVLSLSNDLIFLDPETGSLISKNTYEAPIQDCRTIGEDHYIGILANGTVVTQTGIEDASRIRSESITTCKFAAAKFALIKGVGLFVVGKSLAPTKLATFHFGDSFVASYSAEEVDWLDEEAQVVADNGENALIGKDSVTFLDKRDLKPRASIGAKNLPELDWKSTIHVVFPSSDEAFLWAKASGDEEDAALYRISIGDDTCEVVGSTTLKGAFISGYTRKESDDRLHVGDADIAWQSDDRVILLDRDKLSPVREILAADGYAVECARNGHDTILLGERHARYAEKVGRYRLVGKGTGKDIPSDIQQYSFYVPLSSISDAYTLSYRTRISSGATPTVDAAGERVAIPCSDRHIRVFDLASGSLKWESSEVSPYLSFLQFTAQGNLFVQDEQGYSSLLSGDDGTVVNSTMLTLPPFNKCIYSDDSSIVVTYSIQNSSEGRGAVLILTDEEVFGPLIDMPLGVAIAQNTTAYLAYNDSHYKMYPLTPMDIDVLLEVAHSIADGHELSETESAMYQVDD